MCQGTFFVLNIRIVAVDEKYKKEGEIDDAEFCTVYPNESCIWKRHAKEAGKLVSELGITKVFLYMAVEVL